MAGREGFEPPAGLSALRINSAAPAAYLGYLPVVLIWWAHSESDGDEEIFTFPS